jgi:ATP synthase protein I
MPDDNQKEKEARAWYEAATLGFLFPVCIALGFGMGWGLDKWFHTSPWLTIIFGIFGIAAAFVQLFKTGKGSD